MSRSTLFVSVAGTFLLATAPAKADFSFSMPGGQLGTSQSYGSITAYGFSSQSTATDLYGKDSSHGGTAGENGLGLALNSADHEINRGQFVQLDLRTFDPIGGKVLLKIESVQSGEGYALFASNALGTEGTLLTPVSDTASNGGLTHTVGVVLPAGDNFLSLSASSGDVLLNSLEASGASAVPEPSSLVLGGLGMASLALGAWRRRKAMPGSPRLALA